MEKPKKISMPPTTILNPVPVVMVSCCGKRPGNLSERPNIITLAWVGTINSEPPMVSISVRPARHSHKLISETKEFVINLVSDSLLRACDYCGVRSGKDEDKFAAMSLTSVPAEGLVYAPAIQEAPVSISCKVESITRLETHDMFTAKIVAVSVDSSLLHNNGKLRLEDAGLVAYSHGEYYRLGEYLGFFGFSVASKEALQRRNRGRTVTKTKAEEKTSQISVKRPLPEKKSYTDRIPPRKKTSTRTYPTKRKKIQD